MTRRERRPSGPGRTLSMMDARPLVRQVSEDGCGPACGEMLLCDRGYRVDQRVIAEGLMLPVTAEHLAARLNELAPPRWIGAYLNLAQGASWDFVAGLTAERGTWGALLEPVGSRSVGHWVVVDEVPNEGLISLRDPMGSSVVKPVEEFLHLWRYTVMVI